MKWTKEVEQRVLNAIAAKMPNLHVGACSICGTTNWVLANSYIMISVQDELSSFAIGGPSLPSVAIICQNCGNTHLMNLRMLGLDDLLKPDA
jgi:hypothetical protein